MNVIYKNNYGYYLCGFNYHLCAGNMANVPKALLYISIYNSLPKFSNLDFTQSHSLCKHSLSLHPNKLFFLYSTFSITTYSKQNTRKPSWFYRLLQSQLNTRCFPFYLEFFSERLSVRLSLPTTCLPCLHLGPSHISF